MNGRSKGCDWGNCYQCILLLGKGVSGLPYTIESSPSVKLVVDQSCNRTVSTQDFSVEMVVITYVHSCYLLLGIRQLELVTAKTTAKGTILT